MGLPQLAMPLFDDSAPITSDAVLAMWRILFPQGPTLLAVASESGVHEYRVDGTRSVTVAHIPMSVPRDEALAAVRSSWMWQQPDEAVRLHRAHAIVAASDDEHPIDAAWDVSRVSAALLAAGDGAALYWGSSRQMHPVDVAIELATETETLPVPLWVGLTISGPSGNGPFSAATHGLQSFGLLEFEVHETSMGIGDLRTTLLDLAAYVLDNGPVLEHGQTFGPSATERWPISHEPSRLVDGRDVIVLGIP